MHVMNPTGANMAEPVLPTVEDIAQLPRWARLALAAHWARRSLPLFIQNWPTASQEYIHDLSAAIETVEVYAAKACDELGEANAEFERSLAAIADAENRYNEVLRATRDASTDDKRKTKESSPSATDPTAERNALELANAQREIGVATERGAVARARVATHPITIAAAAAIRAKAAALAVSASFVATARSRTRAATSATSPTVAAFRAKGALEASSTAATRAKAAHAAGVTEIAATVAVAFIPSRVVEAVVESVKAGVPTGAMLADFQLLLNLARRDGWTDNTRVPPGVFEAESVEEALRRQGIGAEFDTVATSAAWQQARRNENNTFQATYPGEYVAFKEIWEPPVLRREVLAHNRSLKAVHEALACLPERELENVEVAYCDELTDSGSYRGGYDRLTLPNWPCDSPRPKG